MKAKQELYRRMLTTETLLASALQARRRSKRMGQIN